MTSKTNKTTKGATTLSSSEERVAEGFAFKDATGTYSEFLLIYEEPGPTGLRTCFPTLFYDLNFILLYAAGPRPGLKVKGGHGRAFRSGGGFQTAPEFISEAARTS